MTDMTEELFTEVQVTIAETFLRQSKEMPWEDRSEQLAAAILPIITRKIDAARAAGAAAMQGRCAVVADKRLSDAEGSYEILEKMGDAADGSLALLAGEAQASGSIATAIRSLT